MARTPAHPFAFFDLHVLRSERLGPSMVRITFGGESVDGFVTGGRDQRFKIFLPHPHQDAPVMPRGSDGDTWFADWRALDPAVRGIMRSYTVRGKRPGELDVDFALHMDGASGPAARWAAAARAGDRVTVLGPTGPDNGGYDFRPPPGAPVVMAGDLTALPAIAGNLAWLPAGTSAQVWIDVPDPGDRQDLPTASGARISWVAPGGLLDAVRAAEIPDGAYAWIAGESAAVKALRRHLVNERGLDRRAVTFTGYWRRGATEEDLLAEVVAGGSPATEE
ncbi:siderophore-interacting protein [Actinomadura citrea]|jgi:NADPH-dependent ferric siderophore reductase|uniref:NADPH-dependent ferric siderophore reductase n=1 Tax=Actinomadura citrea TaxID=46158 RepID=A0A7Y9KCI0_9ACTN|nr:siderophore-interacting protein [Actinomadura citrea]NYE12415.1 NADPH-dependent ferric siderophore reductase [Actinomadura citrea]GGT51857.1 siderophore-interacting protein [Actinomadura citrea]